MSSLFNSHMGTCRMGCAVFDTLITDKSASLLWRHNERDGALNHRHLDCLLYRFSGTDERKHQSFASLVFVKGIHHRHKGQHENVSISWRHHDIDR